MRLRPNRARERRDFVTEAERELLLLLASEAWWDFPHGEKLRRLETLRKQVREESAAQTESVKGETDG
jgi:hypothetical protein